MITRAQIEAENQIANGTIRTLGKFEGEPIYAPYFYDCLMNGDSDNIGDVAFFTIEQEDLKEFPELKEFFGISLFENEQGFIYLGHYATEQEYKTEIESLEKELETSEQDNA